jgi:hypothetical protein
MKVDEKKPKLRCFEDCKLPKCPQREKKNKHMKTLAKTVPFCVAGVSKTLSWFFMIRIFVSHLHSPSSSGIGL